MFLGTLHLMTMSRTAAAMRIAANPSSLVVSKMVIRHRASGAWLYKALDYRIVDVSLS